MWTQIGNPGCLLQTSAILNVLVHRIILTYVIRSIFSMFKPPYLREGLWYGSSFITQLIHRCWAFSPHTRPSFDSVKKTLYRINPNKESAVDNMMFMVGSLNADIDYGALLNCWQHGMART